jgi:hypothetical protein
VARPSGPGRLRFILQPVMAILLGTRDGVKDSRASSPPFPWGLVFHGGHRTERLLSARASRPQAGGDRDTSGYHFAISQARFIPGRVVALSSTHRRAPCPEPSVDQSARTAAKRPSARHSCELTYTDWLPSPPLWFVMVTLLMLTVHQVPLKS